MLCPLSFFQAVFLFVFTANGVVVAMLRNQLNVITFRTVFAAAYLIPYYTSLTPLVMLWIIRKSKRRNEERFEAMRNVVNERDLYFSECSKIWDKVQSRKGGANRINSPVL
ncbi:hypothetical protein OSTOST_18416, partial [Ostertagia ostertagi]